MEVAAKRIDILKQISNLLKSSSEDSISKYKVYGIVTANQKIFFDTKKEIKEYVKNNKLPIKDIFKVIYIGNYLEQDNVVKCVKNKETFIYKMIDDSTYFTFGLDKGKKYRWQFKYGNITEYYKALDRYDIKKLIR